MIKRRRKSRRNSRRTKRENRVSRGERTALAWCMGSICVGGRRMTAKRRQRRVNRGYSGLAEWSGMVQAPHVRSGGAWRGCLRGLAELTKI